MLRPVVDSVRRALETSEDSGASAAEYSLLVAGVAALIVIVVFVFGSLVVDLNADNCTTIRDTARPDASCGP